MNKKQIVLIIVITGALVWVADLFFGNYLSARLSTLPLARKFNLFNPQAPIVVTNRETVRVDASSDLILTTENSRSKVATLVYFENGKMVVSGELVNWTSDGYFLSTESAFSIPGRVYAVVTSSGDVFPIVKTYNDPASQLMIVETSAQGLGLLDPIDPKDLRVGQQVVMVQNSLGNNLSRFATGFVERLANDTAGQVADSDVVSRSLQISGTDYIPGGAILSITGRLIGVWDGGRVVPAGELQLLMNNFLSYQKNLIRPSLGFNYQILTETEAKALQTNSGVVVISVAKGKPADASGLKVGDVITSVDGQKIDNSLNLDNFLRQTKPSQVVKFGITRDNSPLEIDLVVGQLK